MVGARCESTLSETSSIFLMRHVTYDRIYDFDTPVPHYANRGIQRRLCAETSPATSLTPPWIIFEESLRQRDRQTTRRRRPASSRRRSLKPTRKQRIRGSSPFRQARLPYPYAHHLAIPRVLVAIILNHPKNRVGGQRTGQRGWRSRSRRNPLICFCRSRRSWEHSRFSSRIMMCVVLNYLVSLTADRFLQQTTANEQQIGDIEERVRSLAGVLTPSVCDEDREEKARREALRRFVPQHNKKPSHC